ncbi:hypothetical protein IV102_34810 [bacterium]|nr:hypothetical protein [bacterium]
MTVDFGEAKNRRRLFLHRGLRKRPLGSGSNLERLMDLPRDPLQVNPGELFGDIAVVVVGGVAIRVYSPERATKEIDLLVDHKRFADASRRLLDSGYIRDETLFSPNASLGLYGEAWFKEGKLIDLLSTPQLWGQKALVKPVVDSTGLPMVRLPYLVLMKFDSARAQDQADLSRMLGRLSEEECETLIKEVARYSTDPCFAEDVRQYCQLGRWEWGLG